LRIVGTTILGPSPESAIHNPQSAIKVMDYQVDLESFRGPLDLLLFLVKRNEVDVCDIPVARIAEQYLDYLLKIELVDVERAGDFIVMAATLMEIKSRMLLPRTEEEGEEEADPRLELVRQLLEYKKFKDAAALLEERAEVQLTRVPRNPLEPSGPAAEAPLAAVELWDLVSAFGRLMRETLALQPKQIVADETPIHVYMQQIAERVDAEERVPFVAIFTPPHHRNRLIGLFLAILELIKGKKVSVEQEQAFGAFVVCKYVEPTPLAVETPVSREAEASEPSAEQPS
jgi:segregation and condensation protein A